VPYLSASAVVIHYEEALYQVYGLFSRQTLLERSRVHNWSPGVPISCLSPSRRQANVQRPQIRLHRTYMSSFRIAAETVRWWSWIRELRAMGPKNRNLLSVTVYESGRQL